MIVLSQTVQRETMISGALGTDGRQWITLSQTHLQHVCGDFVCAVSACHRWRAGLSERVELRTGKETKLTMTQIRVTERTRATHLAGNEGVEAPPSEH